MKHPNQSTLALLAGGDLGAVARWKTGRHVSHCDQCRREVAEFSALRSVVTELNELPEMLLPGASWARLAAEMKANIRLGLAAGECVASYAEPRFRSEWRALTAYAGALVLVLVGLWLQYGSLPAARGNYSGGVVLAATRNGIELKEGGQTFSLMHQRAKDVTFSVGAQGMMRARYVDSETGYVTINNVYGQ